MIPEKFPSSGSVEAPGRVRTFVAAALAIALTLAACGKTETEKNTEAAKPAASAETAPQAGTAQKPVELTVIRPAQEKITENVVGTGTIAASQKSNIGPSVSGILEKTFVTVGDRVMAGDPLFQIRQIDYQTRLQEAQYQVKLAEAEFANAKAEYERIRELKAGGVVSKGQMDKVQAQYLIAEARLGIAKANLAKANQSLEDTTVRAPYDGVIIYQYKYDGEFISTMGGPSGMEGMGGGSGGAGAGGGGGGGGGGRGVFDISKIDVVGAIVEIPETKLRFVRLGTPCVVRIDGLDREFPGQVDVMNDQVDPVSRKVEIRIRIDNPDYTIKPGLFARATMFPDPRPALTLDRRAVLGPQEAQYVFLAVNGHAKHTPITVRELDARRVEVLKGLTAEDHVLIGPNLLRLRDGDVISVEMAHVD